MDNQLYIGLSRLIAYVKVKMILLPSKTEKGGGR